MYSEYTQCYFVWDFNINVLSKNNCIQDTLDIHRARNIVKDPTCYKGNDPTLLDLVITNVHNCILSWGSQIDKIRLLQKRAIRNVTKSAYTAHTEPLHEEYNILKVQDFYQLTILKFYCKLVNNNLPQYFNAFTPKFSVGHINYVAAHHGGAPLLDTDEHVMKG